MKNFAIKTAAISFAASILLTACGGGGEATQNPSNNQQSSSNEKSITVVDGYIRDATVLKSIGTVLGKTDKNGKVKIQKDNIDYPLIAKGGWIDVNNNNQFDDGIDFKIPNDINFSTDSGYVINPITTLIANGVNASKLAQLIGVKDSNIFYKDPIAEENVTLEKINQIAYAVISSKSINQFKNNLEYSLAQSDLPNFGGATSIEKGTFDSLVEVAKTSTKNNLEAQTFIENVAYLNVNRPQEIESQTVDLKKDITSEVSNEANTISHPASPNEINQSSSINIESNSTNSNATNQSNTISIESNLTNETNPTSPNENNQSSSLNNESNPTNSNETNQTSDVPNFNDFSNPNPPYTPQKSDLPNLNDFNNTNNSTNSSNTNNNSGNTYNSNKSDLPVFSYINN